MITTRDWLKLTVTMMQASRLPPGKLLRHWADAAESRLAEHYYYTSYEGGGEITPQQEMELEEVVKQCLQDLGDSAESKFE
jgi:hypothetical protein